MDCLIVQSRADEYVQNLLNLSEKLRFAKHISVCGACQIVIRAGQEAPKEPIRVYSLFREIETENNEECDNPDDFYLGTFTTYKAAQDAADDVLRESVDRERIEATTCGWNHLETSLWMCDVTYVFKRRAPITERKFYR